MASPNVTGAPKLAAAAVPSGGLLRAPVPLRRQQTRVTPPLCSHHLVPPSKSFSAIIAKRCDHGRVLDNLKDYSVKALVNAVDHLGTVAFKLNDLFSLQNEEIDDCQLATCAVAQVLGHSSINHS